MCTSLDVVALGQNCRQVQFNPLVAADDTARQKRGLNARLFRQMISGSAEGLDPVQDLWVTMFSPDDLVRFFKILQAACFICKRHAEEFVSCWSLIMGHGWSVDRFQSFQFFGTVTQKDRFADIFWKFFHEHVFLAVPV